jgi:hypothetical protein
MINFKIKIFVTISFFFSFAHASDFDNAKFDNYVRGQGVNEVLAEAQTIICALSRMGTENLAGDGSYKATIYMNECEQAAAESTTNTQGSAPSSASSSSSSSSTATTGTGEAAPEIDTVFLNSGFTTASTQTTKGWIVNDKPWNEETNREPKNILYLLNEQTATVSDTNKFGNFTLRYQSATFGNTNEDLPSWNQCPEDETSQAYKDSWCTDGKDLGRGLLIANGGDIKFKSDQVGSQQQNVVATYSDNGDIAGIYTRSSGFMDYSLENPECNDVGYNEDGDWDHDAWWACQSEEFRNSNVNILGIFSFGIEASTKTYCTVMSELYSVDWSEWDEETQQPKLTPYTLSEAAKGYLGDNASWDTEEKCFSIAKDDAIRNIWDYGVFNADGSSLSMDNQSFPIRTTVEVNEQTKRVHGYASYWGVHVDEEYQPYITETTEWVRDDWRDNDSSEAQDKYNLKIKSIEVEKREKSFVSLNSLDGAGFRFWVNDSWWSDQYQKLGFPKVEPYDGKIQFKSSKAIFTDYNNGDSSKPLTYGLYGNHDGKRTYVADLVGAKIDKNNIRKIIKNDPSDPGKAMDLTMEFAELPSYEYSSQAWERNSFVRIYLCNKPFDTPTVSDVYLWSHLNMTDGLCIRIDGHLELSSDGTEMVLSSKKASNGGRDTHYSFGFYDMATGTEMWLGADAYNNSEAVYDFKISLDGVERPAGMELKLQSLFTNLGIITQYGSQYGDNGGDIQSGLEAFLDSSNSFTFLVTNQLDLYDHEGNRFRNVKGTFGVSETPPATVFIDDLKVNEPASGSTLTGYQVSLSSAQASNVTFDYAIAANSSASATDYSSLANGTVTIAAGTTSATIPVTIESDDLAEGQIDEDITITLSNPTNAVLGRDSASLYIYDPDTNRVIYEDYYGSFDAETLTFTISEGIKYSPRYVREDLPAPITFTTSDWTSNMLKVIDEGMEWERTEYRDLNLYSNELGSDFTISHEAMNSPDSATKAAGIVTTKWSRVSLTDLPSSLSCIQECLTATNLNNHYGDVKNQADPAGDKTYTGSVSALSPSPYADVGPYIKEAKEIVVIYNQGTEDEWSETRNWDQGQYQDGIVASDVYQYSISDTALTDSDGSEVKVGVDWGLSRVEEAIKGARFANPEGWERETHWGINTGMLVEASDLQYMECDHRVDENGKKIYDDYHPEFTEANGKLNETRYCTQKMWGNDDILVSYNINIRLDKQYEIFDATSGTKLALDPPKTLFFRAPNDTTLFGDDADKKFRLDYHGDHLGGIPGNVVNLDTGEILGEWVEEWKDNYRWVQRFSIPDGSKLTDSSGTEYLVKALRGEEWLGKKDSAIGTLSALLSAKSKDDLLTNADVDWEIAQREETYYNCNLTYERTETYTYVDENGDTQTQTNTFTETDWDKCHELEYGSEEWLAAWEVEATFVNCNERLQYDYDRKAADLAQWKANAEASGVEYDGPATPYDDPGWMGDEYTNTYQDENGNEVTETIPANRYGHRSQMARCKTIGDIPTSLINGGNASVVNGNVVYDPTP